MVHPLDESLAQLVGDLTDAKDLNATVEQIVRFARTSVGADHAGITMINGKHLETVGHTDDLVWDLDELQHTLSEGPCVDAATEGRTVRSTDLANDARWPLWGPAAADAGMHSILSIELHARGQRVGALNLYGDRFKQFGDEDAVLAKMFAYHAASALAVARQEEQLRQALDTREQIGQAQGILMERFDIDASQAFNVLRRYSQEHNIKLVNVASQLITRREPPRASPSSSVPVAPKTRTVRDCKL